VGGRAVSEVVFDGSHRWAWAASEGRAEAGPRDTGILPVQTDWQSNILSWETFTF
jgi:hypothetical protein